MSLRNYIKKKGKRLAGVWGRINHKRDMRAASKGIRRQGYVDITEEIRHMYANDPHTPTIEEMLECDEIPECEHRHVEWHAAQPERPDQPGSPAGFYCQDCDTWLENPDTATRLGI
jgi:hypothetical protein